ncbi:hypothetical protein [Alicyclobacillus sp. SO9]|uniref:hypothetical protein n=1 Tax=Alicyclobacillus sp. SO9 TaxID=2665646 RepID=UPI0018E8446B|nr:hypothetical protein [Alicyclobacillus sp. SO9]QQE78761.1 hypothetical protein GI364_23415 [Alicyclobacillus sp. SO9]
MQSIQSVSNLGVQGGWAERRQEISLPQELIAIMTAEVAEIDPWEELIAGSGADPRCAARYKLFSSAYICVTLMDQLYKRFLSAYFHTRFCHSDSDL